MLLELYIRLKQFVCYLSACEMEGYTQENGHPSERTLWNILIIALHYKGKAWQAWIMLLQMVLTVFIGLLRYAKHWKTKAVMIW